jgi:hypothetical protein
LSVLFGELVLKSFIIKGLLALEAIGFKWVLFFNSLLDLIICILVLCSFLDKSVDFLFGETTLIVGNSDFLFFARSLILSRDVQNTIGINFEGDFNLRGSSRRWWDSFESEFSELIVILGHGSFSFEDRDLYSGLVVNLGSKRFHLLGGNGSVSFDEDGHNTSNSFDTLWKRSNIDYANTINLLVFGTIENGGLNGSTVSDSFIGVNAFVEGLSIEEIRDQLLNFGNTGGTSNQNEIVDLSLGETGILKRVFDGSHTLFELINAQFFELSSGHAEREVFTIGEGLTLNSGLMSSRESSLGLFALSSKTTESSVVSLDIDTTLFLEFSHAELDESVVEIFSTQMSVSVGWLNFENTIFNWEDRDIEGTTTEIEDKNVSFTWVFLDFVKTVCDSGSGGLVDDSLDVELGNSSSILGGLSLGIVEISGNGDDGIVDLISEVILSDFLHLGKDHSGDFFSLEFLLFSLERNDDHRLVTYTRFDLEGPEFGIILNDFVLELTSNKTLGIEDSVCGISGDLSLGGITDKTFVFSEGNVRGSGVETLVVGNDLYLLILPDTDAWVGGSEINSDSLRLWHFLVVFVIFSYYFKIKLSFF